MAAQSKKFTYRVPHYQYDGYCVYSNAPVAGAMRGYGNPQLAFAREVFFDKIARELKLDPLQFRLLNLLDVGDTIPGMAYPLASCEIRTCLAEAEKIRREIIAGNAKESTDAGAWGLAVTCHTTGPSNGDGLSSCEIHLADDASITVMVGSADIGQGCETTFAQVAAQILGLPLDKIAVVAADTRYAPYDTGTFASSQMYVGGNAVRAAADDVLEQVKAVLAERCFVPSETVEWSAGKFSCPQPDKLPAMTLANALVLIRAGRRGPVFIGRSSFKATYSPPSFAVCYANVAVDKLAGTVDVRHIIQAVDVGTAINPQIVAGQVEGGISMGLGYALSERMEIDRRAGKPVSADLLHYKIPTALDMPEVHVYIAPGYEPSGPFGAKSVGELPAVAVAPAIANAVAQAAGEEINRLPLPYVLRDSVLKESRRSPGGKGEPR